MTLSPCFCLLICFDRPWFDDAVFVAVAVSVISWNVLDVLSVEMFPTAKRGVAMGVLSSLGRVAAILAQLVFSSVTPESALLLR
jgi:nitrate/nitrite transporter NarK